LSTPNAVEKVKNFGAFTQQAFRQLLSVFGYLSNVYAGSNSVVPSGYLTGALNVYLITTNAAPGTLTTQSGAQLLFDLLQALGVEKLPDNFTYQLTIVNQGAGTVTLAGGVGVTVSGTATVANDTTRTWIVQVNGNIVTMTTINVGMFT
jgi:hypothetical protein